MQWLIFTILAMVVITGVRRMVREGKSSAPSSPTASQANNQVQEMVQCSQCQGYVVKHAAACGRANCPFGGK